MPRHTHLLRRGSRYYVNVKGAKDLRGVLKKDIIRKALKTSDYNEAVRRVRIEAFRIHANFENERAKLRAGVTPPKQLAAISTHEAREIVFGYLISLEKMSEDWWENTGRYLEPEQIADSLDTLEIDEVVLTGRSQHYREEDGSGFLDLFLREHRIDCPAHSAAYQTLRPLFRRAQLENTQRTLDRIERREMAVHDQLFRDVFAHTPLKSAAESGTIGKLLDSFKQHQIRARRTGGTLRTYQVPARLLREFFGETRPVDSINRNDIEQLFGLLRRAPSNAAKRYAGLSLEQAIAVADKNGDPSRLAVKTLQNYFNNVRAIFSFGDEQGWLNKNPTKGRWLRASFGINEEEHDKPQFTIEELNRLFRAPLYIGCKNDERGYATPGPNQPKRGRFWLPLIALFQGFRLNEIAQLNSEDLKQEDDILYFYIRRSADSGGRTDKSTKTP
jgi:hypothetical protein